MITPNCKNCAQFKFKKCKQYQIKIERPKKTTCLNFQPKNPFSIVKKILRVGLLSIVLLIIATFFV